MLSHADRDGAATKSFFESRFISLIYSSKYLFTYLFIHSFVFLFHHHYYFLIMIFHEHLVKRDQPRSH